MDNITSQLSGLKHQGYDLKDVDDMANLLVVHLVTQRLDENTRLEWRKHHKGETAKWSELLILPSIAMVCFG